MNDELKKSKIDRFMKDQVMSDSVYDVLLESFLKPKPLCDVNLLAASRLAIDLLQEAWRELGKFENEVSSQSEVLGNIGL